MTMASISNDTNYARLSCRVDARIKQRAEEAAALLGQSITDFTELAIAEKANSVLAQHSMIALSERDFDRFVASIEVGAAPTAALQQAVERYKLDAADDSHGSW
jgi:hypothetical protein